MRTDQAPQTGTHFDAGERDQPSEAVDERISLADPQQVREWASKLGISDERLRELVAQVGPRISDLQQRLSRPDMID